MPANLVQDAEDERHWKAAKKRAEEQGQTGNWAYVVGIFKQMSKSGRADNIDETKPGDVSGFSYAMEMDSLGELEPEVGLEKAFVTREQLMAAARGRTDAGQVPRLTIPPSLTDMPKPVDTAKTRLDFTEPVLRPEGVTRGLPLDPSVAQAFQKFITKALDSKHEVEFRTQVMQRLHYDMKADPVMRKALMQRSLSLWNRRGSLQKSEGTSELEKAEARGGSYHRRVTDPDTGKHRYYYSESDYQKRPDAHVSGADAKKAQAKKAVLAHVGDGEVGVDSLKALSGKFDDGMLADVVRGCVDAGELEHNNGKLKRCAPKMEKAAMPVMTSPEMQKQKSKAKREALDAAGIKTPVQQANEAAKQDAEPVEKSGNEGSRGGHVIGHTASGKPLYESAKTKAVRVGEAKAGGTVAGSSRSFSGTSGMQQQHADPALQKQHEEHATAAKEASSKGDHDTATRQHVAAAMTAPTKVKASQHTRAAMAASRQHFMATKQPGLPREHPDHAPLFKPLTDRGLHKSLDADLEKAEGARGGKVVGHTSSGKPIYAPKGDYHAKVQAHRAALEGNDRGKVEDTKNAKDEHELTHAEAHPFTPAEHHEAAKVHDTLSGQRGIHGTPEGEMHRQMASAHKNVAGAKQRGFSYTDTFQKDKAMNKAGMGAGSRGGHVIGKTKSGKPIYANPHHAEHAGFTKQDHEDAANTHFRIGFQHASDHRAEFQASADEHLKAADTHSALASGSMAKGGGEGSKGGHVIGHTSSGKPIYDNPSHKEHKGFSTKDHYDAAMLHRDAYAKVKTDSKEGGGDTAQMLSHKAGFEAHREGWQAGKRADADAVGMTASGKRIQAPSSKLVSEHYQATQAASGSQFAKPGAIAQTHKLIQKHIDKHEGFTPQDHADAAKALRKRGDEIANDKSKGRHQDARNDKAKLHYRIANAHDALAEAGGVTKSYTPDLAGWLFQNGDEAMKSMDANPKTAPDLCKCGNAMKKGADGMCKACGKKMAKSETTGISSDFGGNPESTDVRAVVELEKADDENEELEAGPEDDEMEKAGLEIGANPSVDEEDISEQAGGSSIAGEGATANGDPDGKKNPENGGSLMNKGLAAWLKKATDDTDSDDDAGEEMDAKMDADADEEMDKGYGDLVEKSFQNSFQKSGGPFIGPHGGKWADSQHKIPWDDKKHAGKPEPKAKAHDEHGAEDLHLTAMNDGSLHGMHESIRANLVNKMASGTYDHAQATKLYGHMMDRASRGAGGKGKPQHDVPTRMAAAKKAADQFAEEAKGGEHDDKLNKKNQKAMEKQGSKNAYEHGFGGGAGDSGKGGMSANIDAENVAKIKAAHDKIKSIDTSKNGFNTDDAKEHAKAFADFHEAVKQHAGDAPKDHPLAHAFSSSLKAKQRADMGSSAAGMRDAMSAASSRAHFADAKKHAMDVMSKLGGIKKSGRIDMEAFQKNGLSAWMKSNIPGADDNSAGTGPADGLPEGVPDDVDQGKDVNGPMMDLDGMDAGNKGAGSFDSSPKGLDSVASGKQEKLNSDDPDADEMQDGAPYITASAPEMGGDVGQGKGSLSKSQRVPITREELAAGERRMALIRNGREPRDVVVGVGRVLPKAAAQATQQPTVIRKGEVVYSDASDLAVDALMKSGGEAPTLDIRTQLQKGTGCPSCNTGIPSWASRCPACGVDLAEPVQKSVSAQPSFIRAPGIRQRVTTDIVAPGGVKLPKI